AHGWTPCGIVQRTARTPARRQNGPRPGTHLGTSAATATESEYCSRFPCVRVDVEPQIYDIYWGLIDDLPNKKVVPMSPTDRGGHERLAEGVFDLRIEVGWSNVALRYKNAAAT